MRYAICNELFHGPHEDWTWATALEKTCEVGYSGWEIAPFTLAEDIRELSPQRRAELGAQIRAAGVEVVGLHWLLAKTNGFHLTTSDAAVRQRTGDYLGELAALCRDLGGSLMVLGSPLQRNFDPAEMTHAQADDHTCTVLERAIPWLEKHQVTLALEPLGPGEGNYWNHASQTVAVIERLNCPWIRLHLDVKAMSTEGTPIPDIIRHNARHMAHFHANDPNLLGPGMGEVDFKPIFAALKEVGYSDWVSVEVFDYAPGVERILRESMEHMLAANT